MFKFFKRKKYITPFIENLTLQFQENNAVFLSENFINGFLIILCINNEILEIEKKEHVVTYKILKLEELSIFNWLDYQKKIMVLKVEGKSINAEHLIMVVSETIRQIATTYSLSFLQTKDMMKFLLIDKDRFYHLNKISVPEDGENLWID